MKDIIRELEPENYADNFASYLDDMEFEITVGYFDSERE